MTSLWSLRVPEIVVADTSPLLYLHRAHILDVLPTLYGSVLVPLIVAKEIEDGRRGGFDIPDLSPLSWIEIRQPNGPIPAHPKLYAGEAAAIALALEIGLRVLIDDHVGRLYLHERHHPFTGTLGVLIEAKRRGLISEVSRHLTIMAACGFWITDEVHRHVLKLAGEAR